MFVLYALFITFILLFIIIVYIKTKYGFWVSQPVFHVYDIGYFLYPPGIINHDLPEKNKYTNFKDIETIVYDELTDLKTNKLINFIKINYLQNKDNVFNPTLNNIVPYFKGHNAKSFVSFYNENILVIDSKNGTTIDEQKIIGIMTSRPIHISIKDSKFDAYYVDYLCVDKSYRRKGIAPQIIQTHHYSQSHINPNINVSLFKREDELTGIVPLCVYTTYGFYVDKWTKPTPLNSAYTILEINPQNLHLLFDFIKQTKNDFDITIHTDISNIIELIKTKNIFIYVILLDNAIQCAYFFRDSCVNIEKGKRVLSCFASINKLKDANVFIHGFKICFWKIADENYLGFAVVESISHNKSIINNLILKTEPIIKSPTAYFFYNFAYHTFQPEKVLIIN